MAVLVPAADYSQGIGLADILYKGARARESQQAAEYLQQDRERKEGIRAALSGIYSQGGSALTPEGFRQIAAVDPDAAMQAQDAEYRQQQNRAAGQATQMELVSKREQSAQRFAQSLQGQIEQMQASGVPEDKIMQAATGRQREYFNWQKQNGLIDANAEMPPLDLGQVKSLAYGGIDWFEQRRAEAKKQQEMELADAYLKKKEGREQARVLEKEGREQARARGDREYTAREKRLAEKRALLADLTKQRAEYQMKPDSGMGAAAKAAEMERGKRSVDAPVEVGQTATALQSLAEMESTLSGFEKNTLDAPGLKYKSDIYADYRSANNPDVARFRALAEKTVLNILARQKGTASERDALSARLSSGFSLVNDPVALRRAVSKERESLLGETLPQIQYLPDDQKLEFLDKYYPGFKDLPEAKQRALMNGRDW